MKNVTKVAVSLLLLLLLPISMVSTTASDVSAKGELRGLWVATVLNIDYPSKSTTDPETLKNEAIKILDSAQRMGLNAVFLQVRPASDAFYKSQYFPWSKYLTGSQGTAPADNFDPLEFWVTEAHKRGLELHAWINPYRVTKKAASEPSYNFASLAPSNPARVNQDWVVKYSDGNLYYNPGIPEVRKLITDSVLEIINNYDVDGIHMDDYFYPGSDFNDKATYAKYGTGFKNIGDWRRQNVNILISGLSKAIKATGKNVSFGISPSGIWANKSTNSLGSDTKGAQSYYDHYADTRKWVKDGLLDYIAPQLYWNIGYSIADYSKLVTWWKNVAYGTGVDLYIGLAAYREGNTTPSSAWYGIAEIEKQLKLNAQTPGVNGSIFYNYSALKTKPSLSAMIQAFYEQRDGSVPSVPVSVSIPSANIQTSYSQYYLNGVSDPGKPLYLNGNPVANRSPQGYFGILVPLAKGENIFTLSQEGSYATRVIYRSTGSASPKKLSTAAITASSTFPRATEYRTAGEKITLSCQAPIGSKVTVRLGGKSYTMKPSTTASYGSGIYATTFTYVYTLPGYTGTPRNISLGAPVYNMTYKGKTVSSTAPAKVNVIMKDSPYYAKVAKAVIDTYNTPNSANGAAYELYSGMVDYVTGMTGSYVRLSSGQWVYKSDVQLYTAKEQLHPVISKAVYTTEAKWDTLALDMSAPAAATADFDGALLKLSISAAQSAVLPALPADSPFSTVVSSNSGGKVQYTLSLKYGQNIEGYYIAKTASGITLNIKRPVKAATGTEPLTGITIMLDPGHGGSSLGAIGPLGSRYAEKDINLKTALKLQSELEKLGAKVLLTRTTDKDVSLGERLAASRNAKPDLFVSIHANSMEDNVDISKVNGFSVFYREALAEPFAEAVFNNTIVDLSRGNKGIHKNDLYVNRGTWAPSILIESGFVPNPNEFEWLTDGSEQSHLAQSIAGTVVGYFTR